MEFWFYNIPAKYSHEGQNIFHAHRHVETRSKLKIKASNLDSVPHLRILHGRAYYRLEPHNTSSSMIEIHKIISMYLLVNIVQAISYDRNTQNYLSAFVRQ